MDDYIFDLQFDGEIFNESKSVGQLYEETKNSLLTFYILLTLADFEDDLPALYTSTFHHLKSIVMLH